MLEEEELPLDDNLPLNSEAFFEASKSKSITSNATLHFTEMSREDYLAALEKGPKTHEVMIRDLNDRYKNYFPQWHFELSQGFNLITYGYGSKLELLSSFVDRYLANGLFSLVFGSDLQLLF